MVLHKSKEGYFLFSKMFLGLLFTFPFLWSAWGFCFFPFLSTLTPFVKKWQTQTGSSINLLLADFPKGTSQQRQLLCDHLDIELLLVSSCPRKAGRNFMVLQKLPQPKDRRLIPQVSF